MAVLRIRIQATDETDTTLNEVENAWGQMATRIAGAIAAAVSGALSDSIERSQGALQALQIATGAGTEQQRDLFGGLVGQFGAESSAAAVASLTGNFPNLQGDGATIAAQALGEFEFAGGQSDLVARTAQAYGIQTGGGIAGLANIAYTTATSANLDPNRLLQDISRYGGTLRGAGYDVYESLEFAALSNQAGVPFERAATGVSQFVRGAATAGVDQTAARESILPLLSSLPYNEANALAQQLFGGEGANVLVDLARSGAGVNLTTGGLGAVQPTDQQAFDNYIEGLAVGGGVGGLVGGFAGQGAELPILGEGLAELGGFAARTVGGTDRFQRIPTITGVNRPDGASLSPEEQRRVIEQLTGGRSNEVDVDAALRSVELAQQRREDLQSLLPQGITYDPEKAAAANEFDQRRIGVLTGELDYLRGN